MFLDIFVLILFFISALIAFLRGFIREALAVVSLGLAAASAYFFGPYMVPVVEGWFGVETGVEPEKLFGIIPLDLLAQATARGGVFLTVLLVLSLMTHFFAEFIKSIGLGAVDRTLGVVFGLLRAAVVVVVLYLPIHMLVEDETKQDWFENSRTHFYVESGAKMLSAAMPGGFLKTEESKKDDASDLSNDFMNEARQKLQALDLLRSDLSPEEQAEIVRQKLESGELQKAFEGDGYSDEFRDQLDQLFQNANSPSGDSLNE